MKISLEEVRYLVRAILKEAECPACGDQKAYIGLKDVECPNEDCSHFSRRQKDDVYPSVPEGNHWTVYDFENARKTLDVHGWGDPEEEEEIVDDVVGWYLDGGNFSTWDEFNAKFDDEEGFSRAFDEWSRTYGGTLTDEEKQRVRRLALSAFAEGEGHIEEDIFPPSSGP